MVFCSSLNSLDNKNSGNFDTHILQFSQILLRLLVRIHMREKDSPDANEQ